jgi:hypothetical protein
MATVPDYRFRWGWSFPPPALSLREVGNSGKSARRRYNGLALALLACGFGGIVAGQLDLIE